VVGSLSAPSRSETEPQPTIAQSSNESFFMAA
jgi:hypothetical protein